MNTSEPRRTIVIKFLIAILILPIFVACDPSTDDLKKVNYKTLLSDDWPVSTPEDQALDPMLVDQIYLNVAELETFYSSLVIKKGFLVAVDYFNDGMYRDYLVVPADWVKKSLLTYSVDEASTKRIGNFHDIGYGCQWWSANAGDYHVNFAWGHGGQLIVL